VLALNAEEMKSRGMPSIRLSVNLELQLWKIAAHDRSGDVALAGVRHHGLAEVRVMDHTSRVDKAEVQSLGTAVPYHNRQSFGL